MSSASVAVASHIATNMGGGAYSSSQSRHKYASPPPRKPKKVKRRMEEQFCTKSSCSERTEMHKDAGGWGLRPAVNSGESTTKANDKFVPNFTRKGQYGQFTPLKPVEEVYVPACLIAAGIKERAKAKAKRKREAAKERERLAAFQRLFV